MQADTMSRDQLEEMRAKVQAALMAREKSEGRDIMYRPSVEYIQAAGAERIDPPYAVMGATVMEPAVGVVWPIRRYPWYVANIHGPFRVHNNDNKNKNTNDDDHDINDNKNNAIDNNMLCVGCWVIIRIIVMMICWVYMLRYMPCVSLLR
jgi:hypothetical protein